MFDHLTSLISLPPSHLQLLLEELLARCLLHLPVSAPLLSWEEGEGGEMQ